METIRIIREDITAYAGDLEGKFPCWDRLRSRLTAIPNMEIAVKLQKILCQQGNSCDIVIFHKKV